jgi:hypothetical protein
MIEVENSQGESIAVKLNAVDAAAFADAVLKGTGHIPEAFTHHSDTIPKHYRVGVGNTQARVNVPDSDTQALRNLNFAVANLRAYVEWVAGSEDRAKLEAESLMLLAVNSRGLRVYNALRRSDYKSWVDVPGNTQALRDKWKRIADEASNADANGLDASKVTANAAVINIQAPKGLNGRSVADLLDWAPRYGSHPGY